MEERDVIMARMSAIKAASQLTDIDERLGYFKQPEVTEDTMTRFNLYYNKILDMIVTGVKPQEGFHTPQKPISSEAQRGEAEMPRQEPSTSEPRDATLPMKKCIWGLVYGDDADPALKDELSILGLTKFNLTKVFVDYQWAHGFIDRNKKVN